MGSLLFFSHRLMYERARADIAPQRLFSYYINLLYRQKMEKKRTEGKLAVNLWAQLLPTQKRQAAQAQTGCRPQAEQNSKGKAPLDGALPPALQDGSGGVSSGASPTQNIASRRGHCQADATGARAAVTKNTPLRRALPWHSRLPAARMTVRPTPRQHHTGAAVPQNRSVKPRSAPP